MQNLLSQWKEQNQHIIRKEVSQDFKKLLFFDCNK